MKFYTQLHRFYRGIDLHARMISACILDQSRRRGKDDFLGHGTFTCRSRPVRKSQTAHAWRSVWSSPWLTHEIESLRCRR
jgi:hypothetical protein